MTPTGLASAEPERRKAPTTRAMCRGVGVVLALVLVGCSAFTFDGRTPRQRADVPAAASPAASTGGYRYPDAPPVLDAAGLRAFVGEFRQKVVLLHCWASWSSRGRTDLAELARLQDRFGPAGLQVIACTLDEPDKWCLHTLPVLREADASFPCVVIRRDAKPDVRRWLAPDWSYSLPARFLIDQQGCVVGRALSGVPLASLTDPIRRLLPAAGDLARHGRIPPGTAALRVKLVDVHTGKGYSLPEMTVRPPDARRLADQAADLIMKRIAPAARPRIAILPFPTSRDRRRAGPFSRETTDHLLSALRRLGDVELIAPAEAQRLIDAARTTALAVGFDPSVIKGRLDCDYLLVGRLRGDVAGSAPAEALAVDPDDTAFQPRRRTHP